MTSPIKPPGGPPPMSGLEGPNAADATKAKEPIGESFREVMDTTDVAASSPTQGASEVGPTARVAEQLAAGQVDRAAAIDAIVAQQLASPEAALLSPAGRVELEAHLRSTLENDPAVAGLLDDLERSA